MDATSQSVLRMKEHVYSTDSWKVEFAAQFLKETIATLWNQFSSSCHEVAYLSLSAPLL